MSLLSQNLQAFAAIVRQGTVHGAADELGLTQTAVTQRIRSLERELSTTLFLRSRKGMNLTDEGQALLRYCKGSEDLEGQALSQIRGIGHDKVIQLKLAGPTSIMSARIAPQSIEVLSKWPNLYLHFMVSDNRDRVQLVRSGQATLAIVPPHQVPNEMDSKILKPDKYVLVAASAWKGRRMNEILENERLIDFAEDDDTSLNYLKKFDLVAKLSRPRQFMNNNEMLIKFLLAGKGFGTLTQELAKPYLESGELTTLNSGAVMEDPLALVWYPRPEMPAYFKDLIHGLR